jgi:hypothetical protein
MRGGFASVVAVPAWGRFMRAATEGAKAEWYEMPRGIEKVTLCSRSGARAADACRHHVEYVAATYDEYGLMISPPVPVSHEPPVYEDIFPVGAVPAETCRSTPRRPRSTASRAKLPASRPSPIVPASADAPRACSQRRSPLPPFKPRQINHAATAVNARTASVRASTALAAWPVQQMRHCRPRLIRP